jgi:hypothetical protein
MTNRDKMIHHIERAEHWQERVKFLEDEAMARATKQCAQDGRGQKPEYVQKVLLKENFWYNQATSNRDSHQKQAQVYGIAALVDAIAFPRVDRGDEPD